MLKSIILLTLLLPFCGMVCGQSTLKIEGTVADSNGNPLPYATVAAKERNIAVVTNSRGEFSISVPRGEAFTLTASFAGYSPSGIKVDGPVPHAIELRLEEDVMNINTVVVTGTRTPKVLKDVPVLTRVITANDIRKLDATNIGDLLQAELPAIEFSYSMNQQLSLDVQGFGGTSVLFLVDGERLAGETLDNVDYSRLNMDNVERVEIVKGAASSLYGSNAVGGVINIITGEPAVPWVVNVNTRYGSHNAWRNGISGSFNQGRWNSVTSFLHTAQDRTLLGYSTSGDTALPMRLANYQYGFHTYSVKERLRFKASDRIDLIAKAGYYFRERQYTEVAENRYRDWTMGLRMNYEIDDRNYLELSHHFDQFDKSDLKHYFDRDRDVRNYSNIQNTTRILFNHTLKGGHTLTFGGDALTDYLMSYQFVESGKKDYRQVAADGFMQLDLQITPRLSMVSGWRADYYSKVDKVQLTPKIALMYKPGDFSLRASYGGGFRTPTLKEMYMKFDMNNIFWIYGNPDLKSETSHNLMLSGEYTRNYWNATLGGYYNSVDDKITTVWNEGLDGMMYVNTHHVNILAADVTLSIKLPCGFGAKASYAYTREYVKKGEVKTSSTRPHTAILRFEYGRYWKNHGFNMSLSGRYMSPVDVYAITNLKTPYTYGKVHYPGYTMWKLILSQKVWRGLDVNATVDNLFNYKVREYNASSSPMLYGTAFSVGISMNIEEIFGRKK